MGLVFLLFTFIFSVIFLFTVITAKIFVVVLFMLNSSLRENVLLDIFDMLKNLIESYTLKFFIFFSIFEKFDIDGVILEEVEEATFA